MRHFILVTGASTGIGENTCKILVERGYHVLAGVRTSADADRLKASAGERLYPLIMDITDTKSVERARQEAESIIGPDYLVSIINNAGIAVSGSVLYIPIEEWRKQFEVNVLGTVRVMQLFFPILSRSRPTGDDHPRRIINISSVSGLFASPFVGPYAASKYALEALSDSLRRELYMFDIQIVLIEPGNILTPIWEKAKNSPAYFGPEHDSILEFREKMIDRNTAEGLPLNALDGVILRAVKDKNVKTRYLVKAGKWKFRLICLLPAKWVDRLIHKKLRQKSGFRPF